jgi:hypothetical protein
MRRTKHLAALAPLSPTLSGPCAVLPARHCKQCPGAAPR